MNIVITGGTKGIGRAIAEKFAIEGNHILVCARNSDDLIEMESIFKNQFPRVYLHIYTCDLSIKEEVKKFSKFIFSTFSKVDIFVNNAGLFENSALVEEEDAIFERTMHTNLFSSYYLSKDIALEMKKEKSGIIFMIGSIAGTTAFVNCGAYTISKFAVHGLAKVLREELKSFGIKVSLIIPGATYTSSWKGSNLSKDRFVDPQDVAEIIFTASQLSIGGLAEEISIQPLLGKI